MTTCELDVLATIDTQRTTVLALFEAQVRTRPDAVAIHFEDQCLSFVQLNRMACQFAQALVARGVEPGQNVGLCIDRCPQAIAAMLGVFKVNAAFVPLDPEYPVERIEFMMADAAITTLITHDRATNRLAQLLDTVNRGSQSLCWIDSASREFGGQPMDFASLPSAASDLAYIMYTSGSTGKPKGVQIEHRALCTYCLADIAVYQLSPTDRTLQFSTLNFDIAIEEIFPPLLSGGSVVIRPRLHAQASNELSQIVDDYGVTALHLATAYWHEWVDLMVASEATVPSSLRMVLATGEKVSMEHYRRWQSVLTHQVLWCNAYGPTETTVTATVFIPDAAYDTDPMPIGKPLPGYEAHILDELLRPVDEGETGHLFIGGGALARGYLNRPELNEHAFIQVPLSHWQAHQTGSRRLYRTGDLARWLPDGNIEFAGRVDHQIKLGSYRIEPGEIEAVLNTHSAVRESLIVHEQIETQKHMIAYVAIGNENQVPLSDLVAHLRASLPTYMVPLRYVLLERLPVTINGKIDRGALPDPNTSRTPHNADYVAPQSDMQLKLAKIWKDVLHVPEVGADDDFFQLGGSSLLATRVISALKTDINLELPVRDFFANPTLSAAARHVEVLLGADDHSPSSDASPDSHLDRLRLPQLDATYIHHAERSLFSVLYSPQPLWNCRRNQAVLICNPIGHEYARGYRNLQQLAVALCKAGFDVLRFDYFGTGNSAGACEDFTAESLLSDTQRAAAYLRERSGCQRLSLLGLRLGATIAHAALIPEVEAIVLWDPVLDGQQHLQLLDRLHSEALSNQTRFTRRITKTPIDQAYGHAMTNDKRASLSKMRLDLSQYAKRSSLTSNSSSLRSEPLTTSAAAAVPEVGGLPKLRIILSRGFAASVPGAQAELCEFIERGQAIQTSDPIEWGAIEYTESAFAAPQAMHAIIEFFSGDDS